MVGYADVLEHADRGDLVKAALHKRIYGPKGRYRTLRLCLDRGVRGASFEAIVGEGRVSFRD
jgi:hypothetical protein